MQKRIPGTCRSRRVTPPYPAIILVVFLLAWVAAVIGLPRRANPQSTTATAPVLISTQRIILKNGNRANLPSGMTGGQVYLSNDTGALYFGTPTGTIYMIPAVMQAASGASSFTGTSMLASMSPTFTIGNVMTVAAGGTATAAVRGTSPNFILDVGLVTGAVGSMGQTGVRGSLFLGSYPTPADLPVYNGTTVIYGDFAYCQSTGGLYILKP